MDFITVFDTDIFFVNGGKKENEDPSIIYKDKVGNLHEINFYTCALNYKKEHAQSSNDCIGERNITEYCFIFYTSGIKTKIAFKKQKSLKEF